MGFDLLTEDDKVFYPLAADTESDLDEWVTTLNKAIAYSQGNICSDQVGAISSFYSKETMKETKKIDIVPELLEVNLCDSNINIVECYM